MPIEKKNLEICLSVHTVHCTHARTLCALALCGKGLSNIFQNIYETRPWVQVGTFWDCLYDSDLIWTMHVLYF